jgi:protein phosphatase
MLLFGKTDVGLRRKNNEDTFLISPEHGFCLVADGMGGAAAGEVASRMFAENAIDIFSAPWNRSEKEALLLVQDAFSTANDKITRYARINSAHKGMGCTAELMVLTHEGFVLGHIGDSRTYRFRDGKLYQLTHDHSLVQNKVDRGLLTAEQAKHHPQRNIIYRAVGIHKDLALDVIRGAALSGDIFLLCSDGLSDMVEDDQIEKALAAPTNLAQKTDRLLRMSLSAGGMDNVTIVLCEIV